LPVEPERVLGPAARAARYAAVGATAIGLMAASGFGGFWLALKISPRKSALAPTGQGAHLLMAASAPGGVKLEFQNPYEELRVLLCTADGKVIVSSADAPVQTEMRVPPGEYKVGIIEGAARWKAKTRTVRAVEGHALRL